MLKRLRDRLTRWLFGPPPREDWEIRHEYIRAYIGNHSHRFPKQWLWCAYRNGLIYYATPDKRKLEDWLDQQENRQ